MTADGAEGVLLDEPTTADLRAKVTHAWREFADALATLLPALPSGAQVEVTLDPTASGTGTAIYSVSIGVLADGVVEALAVGNATLPEAYRMDRSAVAAMVALGWSPPGVLSGSGDAFGLRSTQDQATQVAAIVSRTLRDVYGAPHPAFLVYSVHDENDESIEPAPLATARHEPITDEELNLDDMDSDAALAEAVANIPAQAGDLADRVRTVIATMSKTTVDQLQVDNDGDIGIRAGSAMVFVRVRDNPPLVDVFSPILTDVEPTEQLYVKLSELTNRMPIGRLYVAQDTVWASIPVFGRNFQAVHLMLAVQVMTGLADELDDRLHGEFGGKRFFGEGDKPVPAKVPDPERHPGMYL